MMEGLTNHLENQSHERMTGWTRLLQRHHKSKCRGSQEGGGGAGDSLYSYGIALLGMMEDVDSVLRSLMQELNSWGEGG